MKWLVITCFLLWARHGEGGALKCATESEDAPCPSDNQEIEPQALDTQSRHSNTKPLEAECAPGSEWESNCHSCRCSAEGAAECHRQSSCTSTDIEPIRCKPNTTFQRDCNNCWCVEDGRSFCTLIECQGTPDTLASIPKPLEAECAPGSEWESNCHSCRCSAEGAAECRRQSSCTSTNIEPIRCKPNTTFQRDCNNCWCNKNGHSLCTVMGCLRMPVTARAPSKENLPMGQDCAPGSEWRSGCNDCVCSPEGLRLCSSLGCSEGQEAEPLLRCAPHSLWKKDCNTCWCTSDGRAMCTKIGCVGIPSDMHFSDDENEAASLDVVKPNDTLSRKVRAVPQEPPKTCQPGQEFRMDCNKCLCDNEGQDFSCTRIDCNALNNNNNGGTRRKRDVSHKVPADCVPGSVFDQGCNVCRCTEDGGHAICTLKRCPNKEDNKVSTTESSFRCNPGEQFRQSCNDCTCSADGRSVFCTLFICDEDLTP